MYNYYKMTTRGLEALKAKKQQRLKWLEDQPYLTGIENVEIRNIAQHVRLINAVLTARYATRPLWND